MTTLELTLSLPEPILRRLEEAAAETQRTLADVAAQSIAGNLPPSVADTPSALRAELLALQSLSDDALLAIARAEVRKIEQDRHLALLEVAGEAALTPDEQQEVAALREAADRLMLLRAHAWSILRWRGHPVPALGELPIVES